MANKRRNPRFMKASKDNSRTPSVVVFGPFCLLVSERLLKKEGVPVRVGSRALDILLALVEQAGTIVSHQDLIEAVWPGVTVDESALRVHVSNLRKTLGDGKAGARYITNVLGRGYCFVAPIADRSVETQIPSVSSKSGLSFASNLPPQLQRMIGRDESVQTICSQLLSSRFVSIVASGGMGKTTVAISVAYSLLSGFDGAVVFVDLGSIADSSLVANTVASTLNIPVQGNDPASSLIAGLVNRKLLLILDSCEHLVEVIAPLSEEIFNGALGVCILVTSREAIRAEGEHVYRLPSLESPVESQAMTAAYALTFPAVQLFLERTGASGTQIELNNADAAVVAHICRSLDGLPLAIELVAGRINAHGLRGVAQLLSDRLRLQWQGRRAALPRHKTLNAMLDWSYDLLSDVEQLVLLRLSIFVGTFNLNAAEDVVDGENCEIEVAEVLGSLVEKSLVATTASGRVMIYRLLETTRAYAFEKLRQAGELNLVAKRHACHFVQVLKLVDIRNPTFWDRESSFKISAYLGNVRAALEWCFSDHGDTSIAVDLSASAAPLFIEASLLSEGLRWSREAVSKLANTYLGTSVEMKLQEALATSLMFTRGNSDDVRIAITRGLELTEMLGDQPYRLRFLAGLMILSTRIGDYRAALSLSQESKLLALSLEDPAGIIMSDWMLGFAQHLSGDQENSKVNCEAGLALAAAFPSLKLSLFGYDNRILVVGALAQGLWLRGFPEQALQAASRVLDEGDLEERPVTKCMSMVYTASVFLWCGDLAKAKEIIETLIGHAERYSLRPYRAVGLGLKGELLVKGGHAAAGVQLLFDALKVLNEEQHNIQVTALRTALAEGLAFLGQFNAALIAIDKAIDQAEFSGSSFDMPEILRKKGDLLGARQEPDTQGAEVFLRHSLERAKNQGNLSWELRTARSLAKLMVRQDRFDSALNLLSNVYARFTEGFDTFDLQEAKKDLEYMKSLCN
jgi:predicted ATPase/DNA-binding winged helix-turn-helix (wHTH) protein